MLIGLAALGIVWLRGPLVVTTVVRRLPLIQSVVVSGRVMATAEIQVGVQVSGSVTEVLVREGAHVAAGQVIVRLSAREAQSQVARARALLLSASTLLRRVTQLTAPLAGESLRRALLEQAHSQRILERTTRLRDSGAVTTAEWEEAKRADDTARSEVKGAQIQLNGAQGRGVEAAAAAAGVDEAQAALQEAEEHLTYTEVRAVAAGVVTARAVEVGDLVEPGRTLLTLIRSGAAGRSDFQLTTAPDEKNLAQLAVGRASPIRRVQPLALKWWILRR